MTKFGAPILSIERFFCTAAKAAYHAIPRKLGDAGKALHLSQIKDDEGRRLMLKLSKPGKDGNFKEPTKEEFRKLLEYCKDDVKAEVAIDKSIRDLSAKEREIFLLDQTINLRGVPVDREAMESALLILDEQKKYALKRICEITNGEITTLGQRQRILDYLAFEGVESEKLQKGDVERLLKDDSISPVAREILSLRASQSKSSTAKYESLKAMTGDDNRMRGLLLYFGASTGRWCLTPGHEVLTDQGWTKLEEWEGGKIATYDNGNIYFSEAKMLSFDFNGSVFENETRNVSFECTGDHKILYKNIKNSKIEVSTFMHSPSRFKVLTSGVMSSIADQFKTQIYVMIQADGHFYNTSHGKGLRFRFKKQRKIERCFEYLEKLELKYHVCYPQDGTTQIWINHIDLPKWISDFKDKIFILENIHPGSFIRELCFWDGSRDLETSFAYYTNSKINAEFAATMAHLTGKSSRIVTKNHRPKNWKTSYVVYIRDAASTSIYKKEDTIEKHYCGKVYCAETKSGFFLIRRKGLISITGNSGRGFQPHNLPRGNIKNTDVLVEAIKTKDARFIEACFGDVMNALSCALRGMICAPNGKTFYCADFSAIEARNVFWLAEDPEGMAIYNGSGKAYEEMAATIFNKNIDEIKDGSMERQLGKQAILGCGYGMGHKKFLMTCEGYGIPATEELAKLAVSSYRERFEMVPLFWRNSEICAIQAVQTHRPITYKKITWHCDNRFLYCKLPSGRVLHFPYPELTTAKTPWGETVDRLTLMGMNGVTKQWERYHTYGGALVENVTQAVARDFMAEAMLRLEAKGYPVILTVHDEIICETDENFGSLEEFESIMKERPSWGLDCPIEAKGWKNRRYHK